MTVPSIPELRGRLRSLLGPQLGEAFPGVPDDANLRDALDESYDSLTALECISAVEQEFGLEVDFVAEDVRYWFSSIELMSRFVRDRLEDAATFQGTR